jgi:cell division protein ZapA
MAEDSETQPLPKENRGSHGERDTALVHVEIFGQGYSVRAGVAPGYVEALAAHVDAQMREVSKTPGTVDSVRVAVLAALNLADECFRLRAAAGKEDTLRSRAAELAQQLSAVVDE